MRDLTRKERCAMLAMESQRALPGDYTRAQVTDLRALLARRLAAVSRHPLEPGSMSALPCRDGLAPYGAPDHTGFAEGAVY